MAEEDEKKADAKKDEKAKDPNEKEVKKSRFALFAGIGGVLLVALGVGGFFVFKTISAKKQMALAAQGVDGAATADPHADPKADPHAKDDHGKKDEKKDDKKDDHGKKDEKKDDKKDDHAKKDEKKDDKKDDHGKKDDPKNAPPPADPKNDPNKGTANFGDTFQIPRLDLNLGNAIENRFIRIAVAIEYRGGENQGMELKKREAQIKDIVITAVTSKTRSDLISDSGKESLRREIMNRVNEVSDRPIQNVFFTEFFVE
ncbi:flagellar basal body-associated FliL family protein [Fluviispira multicolorata]|uniref:Flagellar protein FliL n=1 Tax=Fluviispira multicolorata TaxID=2654512 RepID=A0A833N008_9BACT|nr:flagellar basal body-associated FliL family protein [Fluviispira multicolorata]KAB8027718.1 hypothetical protein GCL57_13990 [Fluviispira multicolorata]